ncbi:YciI family protein [Asanoa sp. WMMD1127]|uniref:YciI family protein n=1 Tax=Asanoa sp. WMMD1127 TaxID=3016107 RepID=UPI0024160C63|nr:YciI family protein [Asanoa sp. WMMD1127]MDG4827131.1 YciI family protein [Asanoa sp. WMMD1127]
MKYMIMLTGSQRDFDMLTGSGEQAWTPADLAALHDFMTKWNNELVESGEFVDGQGLAAPVHTRRVSLRDGVPVVTDGPYAETQEVLAGYTIVECDSFDRATEIAAKLAHTPHPPGAQLANEWHVDVRPIVGAPEFGD